MLSLLKSVLPWRGALGACILVSLCANVILLTTSKYQASLLRQLDFADLALTEGDDLAADPFVSSALGLARQLSSSGAHSVSTNCTSSGSHGGSHSGPHPHDAMLYLFNALVIGAAVMQLSARYPILQQTIVLFVIGFVSSLVLKGLSLKDKIAVWGDSYEMWMDIDPHLLLFALLPALLAGDAMTIDTSVARRVYKQCLYLAGPGVLIGGFLAAVFLNVYIEWNTSKSFLLSLCAGSILCATDPVAVVALLKELGASPMLTVQIQGESLLNDGTAIVLYLISYDMLSGKDYDALDIATFLMEKALMAFAIGLFIGYFFFGWIRAVSNKLSHSSSMIQITLTLCCAYWSFIFVEGVLKLSGVLATVASSLVLAHHMWPYVVSEESMHHVWHTFESLGNTIVFFLAGSITGFIVVDIDPIDWLNLVVIYCVLFAIRACLIFGSRHLLQMLHADRLPVTWQDATLMTWGGLRGAVGLALAIQVNKGRAPNADGEPQIDQKDAERLLFFVSGIAFMTTLINATTAPFLVKWLGITALPGARQTMLRMFHQQLVNWSMDSKNPPEVTASLKQMLHEAAEEIEHQDVSKTGPMAARASLTMSDPHSEASPTATGSHSKWQQSEKAAEQSQETGNPGSPTSITSPHSNRSVSKQNSNNVVKATSGVIHQSQYDFQDNKSLVADVRLMEERYAQIDKGGIQLLGSELPENLMGKVDHMCQLIRDQWVDVGMAKVVNQCFLTLVYNNYWKLIGQGKLRPGSPESDILLTSIRLSLSPYRADLTDFDYVHDQVLGQDEVRSDDDGVVSAEFGALAEGVAGNAHKTGCIAPFVGSLHFNIFIAVTILLNSIVVIIEELFRHKGNDDNAFWLIADGLFTLIFVVEFVLKLTWLRCLYFRDSWNRFDFLLVVVGVLGLIMNLFQQGGSLAGQTRVMRLARVLRTMRFLRVFRLFNARLSTDKYISLELSKHLKKITTLSCFIEAHLMAQNDLVRYFGGNGEIDEIDESELARCILQSQFSTYQALFSAADTQKHIGRDILHELQMLYQRKSITEDLSAFVEKAHKDGALSATEAHTIIHPLNHQIASCMKALNERVEGVVSKSTLQPAQVVVASMDASVANRNASMPPASGMAPGLEASPLAPAIPDVAIPGVTVPGMLPTDTDS